MTAAEFTRLLAERVLVCDGAMGTMLYGKGVTVHQNFDGLNLQRPEPVAEIHRAYVQAGVDILETNTFGANRLKLGEYGIADQLAAINRAGVALAREAAPPGVLVAAAIGPLGVVVSEDGPVSPAEARALFREQAAALLEAGVDLVVLETFPGLVELGCAVEAVRALGDLPIVAQLTFDDRGQTPRGEPAEAAAWALQALPVEAVGANCSVGPQPMYALLERMAPHTAKPLSAQPNAGTPQVINHRLHYLTSPEYLALYAKRFAKLGARILGGCCGTTPDHLRAVAEVARALSPKPLRAVAAGSPAAAAAPSAPPLTREEKSPLGRLLGRKFTVSVEISPPSGLDLAHAVRAARVLRDHGVDAVNIPDGPRATARMSPLSLAVAIQTRAGLEAILHACCRDRNLLGLQADLLGAHSLGIRNVLAVTGDPPKVGDYPDLRGVFEIDSVGLVQLLAQCNRGLDRGGRPLGGRTRFLIGVGVNPAAPRFEEEMERFARKLAAGAEFVLTQPVYEPELLARLLERIGGPGRIPILVGILPLAGHRNAEFLHNEVPGMQIPAPVRARLERAGDGSKGREEGIAIAREALQAARALGVAGAYVMPPLQRYETAVAVIKGLV